MIKLTARGVEEGMDIGEREKYSRMNSERKRNRRCLKYQIELHKLRLTITLFRLKSRVL